MTFLIEHYNILFLGEGSMSKVNESKINEMLYQLQIYEAQAKSINEQLNLVNLKLSELQSAKDALDNLSKMQEDQEVLLPIGGGVYFKSKIIDTKRVFVDLGANVIAVKDATNALDIVNKNIATLSTAKSNLEKQLSDIISKSQKLQEILQKLVK